MNPPLPPNLAATIGQSSQTEPPNAYIQSHEHHPPNPANAARKSLDKQPAIHIGNANTNYALGILALTLAIVSLSAKVDTSIIATTILIGIALFILAPIRSDLHNLTRALILLDAQRAQREKQPPSNPPP